ncbi:hypothetical protein HYV89_03940 [Candidatus Woesearchaeota archaeon]|nr:hypothetical protein [Candidatus Woesearchaeota archaeon]
MDKNMLIKNLALVSILILIAQSISAQSQIVSKFEKVKEIETPTLKISFHSWGEGKTEQLNLDQYFPVKRDPNSRYVYLAPPEISVRIDQDAGIAYLTAFKDWTGTREIIFSLTDIYKLEATLTSLQNYREIITQQRAPVRLKQQFEDLPSYHLFEKILDDLESSKIPSPRIEVTKIDNNIRVSVGKGTSLDLDLQTLTEDNLPTLKPKIAITIQPEEVPAEEQEEGLSIFLFIPLMLIIITLLIFGIFYIKNNREKLKKHFKKSKPQPSVRNKLIEEKRELSEIANKLDKQPVKDSIDSAFAVIKNFFNEVTPDEYQFSYSEIKKEQFEKALTEGLKDKLCKFSKEISDIRFSGDGIKKAELMKIIKQAQLLMANAASEEEKISAKKEHEILRKKFPISEIKYILDSFTPSGKELSASKIKEKIDLEKKSKNILHKLGIIRTLAEKELARKIKYRKKLQKLKENQHKKEEEKRKREEEKRKKKLLKLKAKQEKEHLKWLEAQRKVKEKQRKQEEKRKRRLERAKAFRDFLHDKLGLFKTVKDLEKELEGKRKEKLEKERIKRAKKRQLKRSILNFMHFLRIYKTPEEKHEEELILKREDRLKKQRKDRKREARKQAVLSFLHSLRLYRTREEVEREKERRLRRLREKQRENEEEYDRKEKERQQKRKTRQGKKLRKLEEKKRKKHLKLLEHARKAREKELARAKRKESLKREKAEIRKYLHDKLGLFKTLEEKERERELNFRKRAEEKKRKEQKKLEQQKRKEKVKQKQKELSKKQVELRKDSIKKFLHAHFGLYRTREEVEREKKEKLEREISKKERAKKKHEIARAEEKRKLKAFLHDHLGLFKTREEIEKARRERKEHRIELKNKLEDTVLRSLASRLERKKLSPEQEIKILMQLEEEALKKGNTEKSREIQKKINKLYKKIRKSKSQHPSLFLNKLKNNIASARDYLFSSASKLDPLSPFIKKLNSKIRESFAPKREDAKLDQINYLINKAEIELRRNKKEEAKEYYKRALYLYRSLNRASQKIALPVLLKIKSEITSTAIIDSMEKAFSAVYTGQLKKAEKLYKNIDANFLNLPQAEKEKVYGKKEDLYQKIAEHKIKPATQEKVSIKSVISSLFRKKESKKFYPLVEAEESFKPKQQETASVNVEKPKQQVFKKRESVIDFILAKKPKFTSIRTEIKNKAHNKNLIGKMFSHIRQAEVHLQKKSHERAHHNYKQAISIFKEIHLSPEVRDSVYNHFNDIKEKIIHTSIHNFMKKTKESVNREDVEGAKKFHKSLDGVYSHLQRKKEKEILEIKNEKGSTGVIYDLLLVERKLDEAFSYLSKNKTEEAIKVYNQINSHYNNLKPEEKKVAYPRLLTLYSELSRK